MGRKSKLTEETEKRLLDLIRAGVPNKYAASACGMHEVTFYRHVNENANFASAVEKAFGEWVAGRVLKLRKYDDDSWQSIAWSLERRCRKEYGRVDRHEHTGKDGTPIEFHFFLPSNDREDGPEYQPDPVSRNGKRKVTAGEG